MAEKTEFLQAIDDAILDADSLERFINGSDDETVLTRLSAEYPTLQNAIKQMFENGGFPVTPFKDLKTLLNYKDENLKEGVYAIVVDDKSSPYNNGLYIYEAGVWVRTQHNAFEPILDIVRAIYDTDNLQDTPEIPYLFVFTDKLGNTVAYFDEDASLYLSGMKDSVQNILLKVEETNKTVSSSLKVEELGNVSFVFQDTKGNVQGYIATDSNMYLTGLDKSVQESIKEYLFDLNALYTTLALTKAPEPPGLMKGSYKAPIQKILSTYALASDNLRQYALENPYQYDINVVHPSVIEVPKKIMGYSYLLAITPYETWGYEEAQKENPFIYGTNDFEEWHLLKGIDQPLDLPLNQKDPNSPHRDYLSDPFWFYDPFDEALCCGYREFRESDPIGCILYYRKTKNGLQWSEPIILQSFTQRTLPCPALFYDNDSKRWVMHSFATGRNSFVVRYNDTLDPNTWSQEYPLTSLTAQCVDRGILGNHLEVKFIGDTLFMCIGDANAARGFYWAYATDADYQEWVLGPQPIIDEKWNRPVYKGSFIPMVRDNKLTIGTFFTTGPSKFYSAFTSEIPL